MMPRSSVMPRSDAAVTTRQSRGPFRIIALFSSPFPRSSLSSIFRNTGWKCKRRVHSPPSFLFHPSLLKIIIPEESSTLALLRAAECTRRLEVSPVQYFLLFFFFRHRSRRAIAPRGTTYIMLPRTSVGCRSTYIAVGGWTVSRWSRSTSPPSPRRW
jgi:hypothetical protein